MCAALLAQEVGELHAWALELADILAEARRQGGPALPGSSADSYDAGQAAARTSTWAERLRSGAPDVACVT